MSDVLGCCPLLRSRGGRRALLAVLALSFVVAGGCSEKPRRGPAAKAKADTARAGRQAELQKVQPCPLPGQREVTARAVGGIVLGQAVQPLSLACRSVNAQSGQISTALTYATQAHLLLADRDTVRVLAGDDGKVVEVDALTPSFRTADSLRVGMTLGDVLQRRPAAVRDGGLEIRAGQLVVPSGRQCGVFVVFKDGLEGQQISLSRDEIAKQPRSLRVKRLAVVGC